MIKKHPSFVRQNKRYKKRVHATGWRKPRGIDNKQRISRKSTGALPKIGYGVPKIERHHHPHAGKEVLVQNASDLSRVTTQAVRFSGTLGRKKYDALKKIAEERKLKVLN
ncbi:50S ribosomal protein L32e [Candidatus Micrarchaeota archaeon]|nr:50S ribosomal protein L32e [Candidatus Micrarchaeota archaeon]